MPLNGEELLRQKKFERDQYARPTKEQLEIALLEQRLEHAQNTIGYFEDKTIELEGALEQSQETINHLNSWVDKLVNQRDRINGEIALYESHERSANITLDSIRAVLR